MPLGHGPEELCNTAAAPRTRGRRGTPLPTTARPRHGATRAPLPRPQSWADEDGPCSTAPATSQRVDSHLPRPAPAAGVDGTGPPAAPSPCMPVLTPNLMVLPRRPSVPRSGLSPLNFLGRSSENQHSCKLCNLRSIGEAEILTFGVFVCSSSACVPSGRDCNQHVDSLSSIRLACQA